MASSTSLIHSQNYNDLSSSGYTVPKQVSFSFGVAWSVYVRTPISSALEQASRIAGFTEPVFAQRWNRIPTNTPGHLYLGCIPVKGFFSDESDTLTNPSGPGITAVLCMTEGFENHTQGYLFATVTPEDWRRKNVSFLQLETPDHQGMASNIIEKGVSFIDEHIRKGGNVFTHCKAGMSRSATIVICYLLKYHRHLYPTFEKALKFVQKNRSQVCLEESKIENVKHFIQHLNEVYLDIQA